LIRLLIAATSPVVRAGLESLAGSDPQLQVLGAHADLSAVDDLRPDVVLAAVGIDDLSPAPAIVLVSDRPEGAWTQQAVRMGLRAVLPGNASAAAIVAAIEAAAAGMAAVDPNYLEEWLTSAPRPAAVDAQPLTQREREVLQLMSEGAANKTIAWKLGVSEHTVKFHVTAILTKLDAGSRTEAVTIGIRQGLILI
jgi:two-component system, NarL family, response regulator YdfI